MRGRASRAKGRAFEQWVARELRTVCPEAKRGIGQARQGSEVCDVEGSPFRIECKRTEKLQLKAWFRKAVAERNAVGDKREVVIVHKANRKPIQVYRELAPFGPYSWEDFLEMCRPFTQLCEVPVTVDKSPSRVRRRSTGT